MMMSASTSSMLEKLDAAILYLKSTDVKVVAKGLNFLLAKSADGFEQTAYANIAAAETCPKLVIALGELLDVVNPLGRLVYENVPEASSSLLLSHPAVLDGALPPAALSVEFKFLGRYADDNPMLLSCLTILRNLSFESPGEPLVAFSAPVMRHLSSLLLLAAQSATLGEATYLAMDILTRVTNRIDFFAKRRGQFTQQVLEPLPGDRGGASAAKLRLSTAFASSTANEYVTACRNIIPALFHIIRSDGTASDRGLNRAAGIKARSSSSRLAIVSSLELLSKLANNPDNHSYFLHCPASIIQSLVQLLIVSNTRGEGLVPENQAVQGDPFGRFRPPATVLLPRATRLSQTPALGSFHSVNYSTNNSFAMDYVDLEVRDWALDLLSVLCKLSRNNMLGLVPKALPYLLRIVQAQYGSDGYSSSYLGSRAESAQKALSLLQMLALLPESDQTFRLFKTDLMLMAARDDMIADMVLNKGHPAFLSMVDNSAGGTAETAGMVPQQAMDVVTF